MKIDFSNALKNTLGTIGIDKSEIEKNGELLLRVKENIVRKELSDYYPLMLPIEMLKEVNEIKSFANYVLDSFDNLVVIGMGGSVLGNELLHYAINGIYANLEHTKKVYFLDNIDPETTLTLLSNLDLKKTYFNFITKSGSTSETLLNILLVFDLFKKNGIDFKKQVLFTTDPEKGFLRRIANEWGIKAYPIHPLVGGRYSVLSHVGLFSAAFEGIDIEKLLQGALQRKEHFETSHSTEEASLVLPYVQYKLFKENGVNINVLFSYSDGLEYLSKWYEQLLAESIGKKYSKDGKEVNVGITPVVARGPYHQHSTLQLFMEGPLDKLIIFLFPQNPRKDYKIEREENLNFEELEFLFGKNYSELLKQEYIATKAALTKVGKPNISIEIPQIDETTIGELIYFFELEVLALGELFNINPIDQPSVEIGKKFTHALMRDKKFESYLNELEKLDKSDKFILD